MILTSSVIILHVAVADRHQIITLSVNARQLSQTEMDVVNGMTVANDEHLMVCTSNSVLVYDLPCLNLVRSIKSDHTLKDAAYSSSGLLYILTTVGIGIFPVRI